MRKPLLFLVAIMATCVAFADEWQQPTYSGNYQPLITGTTFYIYNTESKLFLTEGNEYGTHASVGTTGLKCVVESYSEEGQEWDNKTYTIKVSSLKNGSDDYLFITDGGQMYVDCRDRGNHLFYFNSLGSNTFQLTAADANPTWNATNNPGFLVGHDENYITSEDEGTPTGTGVIYDDPEIMGATFHTIWAFVSEEDYATYLVDMDIYEAAQDLKEAIENAEKEGVTGLDDEKAVYANTSSTLEALEDAIESVTAKLLKYYETSVTPDSPKLIDKDECNSTDGWTNELNASTWETGTWMDPNWTGYDGTRLNIWGASCVGKAYKQLKELPKGIYVVSMAAYCDKTDAYVYANRNQKAVGKSVAGMVYEVTTNVTDGTLEYGFGQDTEGENWVALDNAEVKYYGSGLDAYKYWLNSMKESAPNFDDVTVQTTLVNEYKQVMEEVEKAETETEIEAVIPKVEDILNRLELNIAAYEGLQEALVLADEMTAAEGINDYYGNKLSDESSAEGKQSIVEKHELGTEEVQAATDELEALIEEAQNYIWENEKLVSELTKAEEIYNENKETCPQAAIEAYNDFLDAYSELDLQQLTYAQVKDLLSQLYKIEFNLGTTDTPASDENPVDYTARVAYPSFDDGVTGWTNDGWSTCGTNDWNSFADGYVLDALYLNLWNQSNARVYQTLTDLPEGTYVLQISAFADAAGLQVYANNDYMDVVVGQNDDESSEFYTIPRSFGETTEIFSVTTTDEGGTETTITPTVWYGNVYLVTTKVGEDGTLEIGARNAGGGEVWAMIDNVKLTYYGTDSSKVPTSATGIDKVKGGNSGTAGIYSLSGTKMATWQKGINIVRYSDGTVKKVLKK